MSIHGDRAYAAFMQGFNCAQSVAVAFAPELGLSEEVLVVQTGVEVVVRHVYDGVATAAVARQEDGGAGADIGENLGVVAKIGHGLDDGHG